MRLLTDMEIMAHADYFVGGHPPNYGRVIGL